MSALQPSDRLIAATHTVVGNRAVNASLNVIELDEKILLLHGELGYDSRHDDDCSVDGWRATVANYASNMIVVRE